MDITLNGNRLTEHAEFINPFQAIGEVNSHKWAL